MSTKVFNTYTNKEKPEDADLALVWDSAASKVKSSKFSGIMNYIIDKLATAVTAKLQTSNKTVIGAINELNSNFIVKSALATDQPGTAKSGSTVKIMASASGGTKPYTFTFGIEDEAGKYVNLQTSTENTYTWKTSSVGRKLLNLKATDANGVSGRAYIAFEVTE